MAGVGLCSLVALLWTPGDACWPTEEPPYPDWLKPTEALPTPDPLLQYHQWAAILSWSMLAASLCLSSVICCCSLRWSGSLSDSDQSSYEQWIQMEELEPSGQASTSPEPLLGPVAAEDEDDTDEPFPLPIVQFHRAQDDSSEDEGTPGSLVHRNVSCLPEPPGPDTEPPAEQ